MMLAMSGALQCQRVILHFVLCSFCLFPLLAALAASGLEVAELSAREVKKAVAGTGAAGKAQVQDMVVRLLDLTSRPPTDAADALAVAICQAHAGRLAGLGVSRRRRSLRSSLAASRLLKEKT